MLCPPKNNAKKSFICDLIAIRLTSQNNNFCAGQLVRLDSMLHRLMINKPARVGHGQGLVGKPSNLD